MRDYKHLIDDVLYSIEKIQDYTRGISCDRFITDPRTYDSVLHNLMIIGEAAARFLRMSVKPIPI